MAQTVSIILFDEDRKALEVIAADRSRPLKHIQRAKIVLHSAGRQPSGGLAVWRSGGLAVAIALCRRGRRRSAARQDTQAGTRAALAKSRRQSFGADLSAATGRRHPLDRPRHGQGRRDFAARRATPANSNERMIRDLSRVCGNPFLRTQLQSPDQLRQSRSR